MTDPSREHKKLSRMIMAIKDGHIVKITPLKDNKAVKYFPDVKNLEEDIEVQMIGKREINEKAKKWDKNRKKILVIGVWNNFFELFNEIWIGSMDNLTKIYDKNEN